MTTVLTPNARATGQLFALISGGWLLLWLVCWALFRPAILPSPWEVVVALPPLWNQDGLGQELQSSLRVNLEALGLSVVIGLPLAYASRLPLTAPLSAALAKMRFLSPSVFFVLLLFATTGAHALKVGMLVTGETFFLVASLRTLVLAIPDERFDEARTLRMNEWRALWYVVVRGTLADALAIIRDNAAMGWSMLMMVEGIVRSEGGLGVLLVNQERFQNFASLYAIALVIIAAGVAVDASLVGLRKLLCPYTVA